MCGIAGCVGAKDTKTVNRMLDALPHRGPNDRGLHIFENGVFGHTRLSIVDVAHGHQPILANDGTTGIVCNGEIYNFAEIKKTLTPRYRFKTDSDTEVILHLYREEGPDCVKKLNGMFAFAIFDGPDVMLARDPIGIKPLYYAYDRERIYFTSELGAMTLAGVEEVHEFPAGHYYTSRDGFVRYYRVPAVQDDPIADVEKAVELIRRTLIKAVKDRLLSDPDVPVGSFCSGGLDSSLVAAIAAENIPRLHTFAVGMRGAKGELSDDLKA
ncbi:MAG: asparagine synthase-related protein, partial [Desulfobacterales bacterium]